MRIALLLCAALPLVPACQLLKHAPSDAGTDAAPSASASAAPSDTPADTAPSASAAPTHAHALAGPPAAGVPCVAGKDTSACAHGGFEELTCTGGVWKVSQTCRGPAGCKGEGAAVHCDVGAPQPGDACAPGAAPSCTNKNTVLACQNGKWITSLCVPPATCQPTGNHGMPGCK